MLITTIKTKTFKTNRIERAAWRKGLHLSKTRAFCKRLKKKSQRGERIYLKKKDSYVQTGIVQTVIQNFI